MNTDDISAKLNQLNQMGEAMNKLLSGMLDDIQKDWSEDDKLKINNPKEYYKKLAEAKPKIMAKQLSTEALKALNDCTVEGNVVKLGTGQLDRAIYVEVKKALDGIGGAWKSGKVGGFVFPHNPAELLAALQGGEQRNLKKEFQFFGTPAKLCDKLVQMAEIEDGMCVLEPSAGQGAIIEAIFRAFPRDMKGPNDTPCVTVDYLELMPQNKEALVKKLKEKRVLNRCSDMGTDFLSIEKTPGRYKRIIANPPFNKNQDIDHIQEMYRSLKSDGIMVSVASKHWQHSSGKKETAFREWLDEVNAEITEVEAGEFKESGTSIATCIIKIKK